MRAAFADAVRCPACRAEHAIESVIEEADAREIRTGALACRRCGHRAPIEDGIVDLMHDPPDFVVREAAGLERFAETMRNDGWTRAQILGLPYEQSGYWYAQAMLMHQVLDEVELPQGARILDVGSNTCWASATFASKGLDVVALDIAAYEMQGLRTAEWWMEDRDVFMERVLGVMFDLPFAPDTFDFVWACEVLHHNHPENLRRTLNEAYRVLRPGGRLIVGNEPLRSLADPKLRPGHDVAEYEGHEHAYLRATYVRAARRAGFDVEVRGPWTRGVFQPNGIGLSDDMPVRKLYGAATVMAMRRSRVARKAYLAARSYLLGETSLHMVCTKPTATGSEARPSPGR
jgi:SAM-dependent methyltransferase